MNTVYHMLGLLLLAVVRVDGKSPPELHPEDMNPPNLGTLNVTDEVIKTAATNNTGAGVWGRKINMNLLSLRPEMFQTFYVFLGISFLLIFFILFRMYRLRSHRAERRYGVQGDKSAQELTHLPTAMEEDESELEEDETLFDINKTRVYVA